MFEPKEISVDQIEERVIDIRSPREFYQSHAPLALNLPMDSVNPHAVAMALNVSESRPIYIISADGVSSQKVCRRFSAIGYSNVVNVRGGMVAWEEAGLPVVRSSDFGDEDDWGRPDELMMVNHRLSQKIQVGNANGVFAHAA